MQTAWPGETVRLTSVGSAYARSMQASGIAAAALARSQQFKQLASIRATITPSMEAFNVFANSRGVVRMGDAHRRSIASAVKSHSRLRAGIDVSPPGSSTLFEKSNAGFSRLSHLSRIVKTEQPSFRTVSELVGDELGNVNPAALGEYINERDESAMHAAPDPELNCVRRANRETFIFNVGFELSIGTVPVPQAIQKPAADAEFNPQYWQIFNELEQRLRQFVEQHLKQLYGPNWTKQKVPQIVRERWLARQETDRATGRPVYADIQYADFIDLLDIITKRDNWREAFETTFGDPNDFSVSLRRLHPVRKALAHSRPLDRVDALTLVSEATRIFRALGNNFLH